MTSYVIMIFFFFQAEDGIRDRNVTGVQTCALPISLITHAGAQSGIQVALRPLGARALLGLPAGELAELDLPAEAVLGGVCAELRDRVRAAASWPERFAVLDEILLRSAGLRSAGLRSAGLSWAGPSPGIAPEVRW